MSIRRPPAARGGGRGAAPERHPSILIARIAADSAAVNDRIHAQFEQCRDGGRVKGSHYFGGRHENIYVDACRVPALQYVLDEVRSLAGKLLRRPESELGIGFWFNEMKPGDSTTLHHHDEFDELLSGVYYVRVPEGSGNLIVFAKERISDPELRPPYPPLLTGENRKWSRVHGGFTTGNHRTEIVPEAGMTVFFTPACMHEVPTHTGVGTRLSVGFNIGTRAA